MKGLKKLALASAVAAAPFAQAELTAMDDALLGEMTGQAGLTIDVDLDMTIAEIRYADEDGFGEDIDDGGFLTLSNLTISGDQGNGTQALIRGVTIDVDSDNTGLGNPGGIVLGFGQIGGQSNAALNPADTDLSAHPSFASAEAVISGAGGTSGLAAASGAQVAALTGNYWTGVNVSAEFGINGAKAGDVAVKGFTNFVPNALAVEGVKKFGYTLGADIQLTNDNGTGDNLTAIGTALGGGIQAGYTTLRGNAATNGLTDEQVWDIATIEYIGNDANGFADALAAGDYVDAWVSIAAGGADDGDAAGTAEGLTIQAAIGFVINELSFTDDGRKMGFHNFTMYDTDAGGNIVAFSVQDLKIDVVERTADANSSATAALQISGLNTSGNIAIGDIFIGDHKNGSIGAVAIKDIDMSNTAIRIYGH